MKQDQTSQPVDRLRNIGPMSADWLRSAGIETIGDLKLLGAVAAFQLVRAREPRASLNLLWALAAGLNDCDWRELTDEQKRKLREAVDQQIAIGISRRW